MEGIAVRGLDEEGPASSAPARARCLPPLLEPERRRERAAECDRVASCGAAGRDESSWAASERCGAEERKRLMSLSMAREMSSEWNTVSWPQWLAQERINSTRASIRPSVVSAIFKITRESTVGAIFLAKNSANIEVLERISASYLNIAIARRDVSAVVAEPVGRWLEKGRVECRSSAIRRLKQPPRRGVDAAA